MIRLVYAQLKMNGYFLYVCMYVVPVLGTHTHLDPHIECDNSPQVENYVHYENIVYIHNEHEKP